jgi:hypothetical protein
MRSYSVLEATDLDAAVELVRSHPFVGRADRCK